MVVSTTYEDHYLRGAGLYSAASAEVSSRVDRLLSRIPSRLAETQRLALQGRSQREIGRLLGAPGKPLSQGTISVRLGRAREALLFAAHVLPDLLPSEVESAVRSAVVASLEGRGIHPFTRKTRATYPRLAAIYWREWTLREVGIGLPCPERTAYDRRNRLLLLPELGEEIRRGIIAIRDRQWMGGRAPR